MIRKTTVLILSLKLAIDFGDPGLFTQDFSLELAVVEPAASEATATAKTSARMLSNCSRPC